MIGDYSIRDIGSFGDVAAEDDSVLEHFLSTNVVDNIKENRAFLVLGRKGTRKTAIVRYLTEGSTDPTVKSLNLRGYPWNIHASRIDHGASEIEAYVSSWRYLIAVEAASLLLSHPYASRTHKSENINKFMLDNYGGPHPSLSDILRPKSLKFSKASFTPAIMGNQIGGVDLERKGKDYDFGLQLNAVSEALLQAVSDACNAIGIKRLSLHFDELDQGLSQLDDARKKMLSGLIIAAREVRRNSSTKQLEITPVIYLRSDIWDELKFSDKNKISQNSSIVINWDSDGLSQLIDARIKSRLGSKATWDDISEPDLGSGLIA